MGPDDRQPQSAVQGVTQVATGAIDALKSSPALLVLVLMQLVTLGILAWNANSLNTNRHEREMFMLNKCFEKSEGYNNPRRSRFTTTSIGKPMQGPPAPEDQP